MLNPILLYSLYHVIILTMTFLGAKGYEWAPVVNGFFLWFEAVVACEIATEVDERGIMKDEEYNAIKRTPWTLDADIILATAYIFFYVILDWRWSIAAAAITLLGTSRTKKIFNQRALWEQRRNHSPTPPIPPTPPPPPISPNSP